MRPHPFDGTYIAVSGPELTPSTLLSFRGASPGLADAEILSKVRFVQPDDPAIPSANGDCSSRLSALRRSMPNMRHCIALWPDGVLVILSFRMSQQKPRELQLLRAYRNGRQAKSAIELFDQQTTGRSS